MMNYERSCRLCLTDLTEAPVDCSTIPELHETIKVLFDVQICRTDNIRGICNRCLDYVMGYRALKKKITECQKIIEDYEEVRKKVMETRNIVRAIPIKQEVIDVDVYECSMPDPQSINRIRPKAVTDSDINDILAIVHDKSMPMVSYRKSAMRPIKLERPSPPREEQDTRSPSIEPISSTSKDLTEKPAQRSTSSALPVGKAPFDVTEAVSSSVQTPTEKEPQRHTERVITRKRQLPTAKSPETEEKTEPTSAKKTVSKVTRSTRTKSLCPPKAKADAKSQTREKLKKDMDTSDSSEASANTPDIKEEDSITSTGSKESSIRRSARKAKSEALQKITHNADNLTPQTRRSPRVEKSTETPNNSLLVEPQQTSTPVISPAVNTSKDKSPQPQNQTIKSENGSPSLSNSTFLKETSLNKSDKKRIITITLVRTKDSLNFRYCDQLKRNIDFQTVSPDELEDIRKSLMIPDIWANLREAFKNSPPDGKTIEQLKTILGDEFVL